MISRILLSALIFVALFLQKTEEANVQWGYRDDSESITYILPNEWNKVNIKCAGYKQSPIDINFSLSQYDSNLPTLNLERFNNTQAQEIWTISNNGHTVQLKSNKIFRFKFSSNTFEFRQMHFHWRGSEHKINGHNYASELHLVHENLDNLGTYAVVGFLFQLEDNHNPKLDPIINSIKNIRNYGSEYNIQSLKLDDLLPTSVQNYFTYSGSLTTPNCDEVVTWLVADKPIIGISENQLLEFQSLLDQNKMPILTNSRPVQLVNNRIVKRSYYPFNSQLSLSGLSVNSASVPKSLNYFLYLIIILIFFN